MCLQGRAKLYKSSVSNLSFLPTASVDKIFHMNCIYFWPDLDTALRELLRVLRPRGRMLTATKFGDIAKLGAAASHFFHTTNETRVIDAMRQAGYVCYA